MSLDRVVGKPAFTVPVQRQNEDLLPSCSLTDNSAVKTTRGKA